MRNFAVILFALVLILSPASAVFANQIHVPDDYETIQAAIDAAEDGDEVLVSAGVFEENINFNGKNISLIGDPDHPEDVIIDGGGNGSVVKFQNGETREAIISGFTIQNGSGTDYNGNVCGGGVFCLESSPVIEYCRIRENTTSSHGGGLFNVYGSPEIKYSSIQSNHSNLYGGGISSNGHDRENQTIFVSGCEISFNSAGLNTSGIQADNIEITHCTISNNMCVREAAIGIADNGIILNSIVWNNTGLDDENIRVITFDAEDLELDYSCFDFTLDEINVVGDGEISQQGCLYNQDPLFADPDNGDFHLQANSPCIDTGDPESDPDPDGTRADMGAWWFQQIHESVVIHVPDDYETIQAAIDAAEDGDEVLVSAGVYEENINFNGKNISLIGDPDHPEDVVIDGGGNGSVVTFENGEDELAVICGFTIRNGRADNGSGLWLNNAHLSIEYVNFTDNFASQFGGGIYALNSELAIANCNFANNTGGGAGTTINHSCADFTNCVFQDNLSHDQWDAGAVEVLNDPATANFVNCVFTGNYAARGTVVGFLGAHIVLEYCDFHGNNNPTGGAVFLGGASAEIDHNTIVNNGHDAFRVEDAQVILYNTIIQNHDISFLMYGNSDVSINYSDLQNGEQSIEVNNGNLNYGDGNIDSDPLFVDPDNGDFHLQANSPCIDTGDPESDPDPDGTRADMGAWWYEQEFQCLIQVGGDPYGLVFTPDGAIAYVANEHDGLIVPIDAETRQVSDPIEVGYLSRFVTTTSDGEMIYTSCGPNSIYKIQTRDHTISSFSVGGDPMGLVIPPGDEYLYVARWSGNVSIVDLASDEIVGNIDVAGRAEYAVLNPSQDEIWVTCSSGDRIYVIDLESNEISGEAIIIDNPSGFAFSEDGQFAYVSKPDLDQVQVISVSNREIIHTIETGDEPRGIISYGDYIYVTIRQEDTVTKISKEDYSIVETIEVGSQPYYIARRPGTHEAFITCGGNGTVHVVELETPNGAPSLSLSPASLDFPATPLGETSELAFTISNTGDADLIVSDISTEAPFSVAFDGEFSIIPGESQDVVVSFTPEEFGVYEGALTIQSNDPNGEAIIDLKGFGLEERDFQLAEGVTYTMVKIPAGSFMMGANNNDEDYFNNEIPRHLVHIEHPVWVGKYEVTQSQWVAIIGNNPSRIQGENYPVDQVSWEAIQGFEEATGNVFRLPTEAEWEYACRGGVDETRFWWGDDPGYEYLSEYAWVNEGLGHATHEVGQLAPNPWGLYDILGNLYEWCEDTWHDNYEGAPDNATAWVDVDNQNRIKRGGCMQHRLEFARPSYRSGNTYNDGPFDNGFRLVRDVEDDVAYQKLQPTQPQASSSFGLAVDVDAGYLVSGAYSYPVNDVRSGAAFVFHFEDGNWIEQDILIPDDGGAGNEFGGHVGISGNYAVVGSAIDNLAGAAYVYHRDGDDWNQISRLRGDDIEARDGFGCVGLDIDNDWIIVGAHQKNNNQGKAYIFHNNGDEWIQDQGITAGDGAGGDWFGWGVAIDYPYAAVSAFRDDDNGANSGSVYIFEHNGESWNEIEKILSDDISAGDEFGDRIAMEGHLIIVGARHASGNVDNTGAAYIFQLNEEGWTQQSKLFSDNGQDNDYFGGSVDIKNGKVIVGSFWQDINGMANSGAVYFYRQNEDQWYLDQTLIPQDLDAGDELGWSSALSESFIVAGSRYDDDNAENSGAVYVYQFAEFALIPEISFSTESLSFPATPLGEASELAFTISNTGDADLIVSDISTEAPFSVAFDGEFSITPGESQDVVVSFTPEDAGEFVGVLEIVSNDPENQRVELQLTGSGEQNNRPPECANPVRDQNLLEDFEPFTLVNLNNVFIDPDEDEMTFVASSDNESLLARLDNEGNLSLSTAENWNGQATITICADDGVEDQLRDNIAQRTVRRVASEATVNFDEAIRSVRRVDSKMETQNRVVNLAIITNSASLNRDAATEYQFNVTVHPDNDAPVWVDTPAPITEYYGQVVRFTLVGDDIDSGALELHAPNLPENAELIDGDPFTWEFNWETSAEDIGEHSLRFILWDGEAESQHAIVEISVIEAPWIVLPATGYQHTFTVREATVYPELGEVGALSENSWIGVFRPDSSCVAAGIWLNEPLVLNAVGDNPETEEIDGFIPGESIHFRVFKEEEQIQMLGRMVIEDADMPRVFAYDAETGISLDIGATSVTMFPAQHFNPVQNEMQDTHSIVIRNPTIYGQPLEIGDEIAAFDGDLCVGAEVFIGFIHLNWFEEMQVGLIARPDDRETEEVDGFVAGHQLRFKIWDYSANSVTDGVNIEFMDGDRVFVQNGMSRLSLHGFYIQEQEIPLHRGWSIVSTNLADLVTVDIPEIWAEVVHRNNLTITKNLAGHFYAPAWNFCNIDQWHFDQGYQVYVQEEDVLIMRGFRQVNVDEAIQLSEGWNMIAYFPDMPVNAIVAFENIVEVGERLNPNDGHGTLLIAKDENGQFYVPAWEFSNMGDLNPTKGYQVKVSDEVDFVWSTGVALAGVMSEKDVPENNINHFVLPDRSGRNMSILIAEAPEFLQNTELGVIGSSGKCLGGVRLRGNAPYGMAIWGDDVLTNQNEGAREGESFTLVSWDGLKERVVTPEFLEGCNVYYTDDFAAISITAESIPMEFELAAPYPNPFNAVTRLTYGLPEAGKVSLAVYDIAGREIAMLFDGDQTAGMHAVSWNAQGMPSGLYFVRLSTVTSTLEVKVLLMK